jgi:hypothetical protein
VVPNVESQHKDERDAGEVLVYVEAQGLEHLPDAKYHSDLDRWEPPLYIVFEY